MSDRAYQDSGYDDQQRDKSMNIFFLHSKPSIAATYHCNLHVNKMRSESCLMLSAAWHVLAKIHDVEKDNFVSNILANINKLGYPSHPCSRWVREHSLNYIWLFKLAQALCREHELRFGSDKETHLTFQMLEKHLRFVPNLFPDNLHGEIIDANQIRIKSWGTEPVLCMPAQCQVKGDPVQSYRNYYRDEKAHLHYWGEVPRPSWL